jgi:hypothetical protein
MADLPLRRQALTRHRHALEALWPLPTLISKCRSAALDDGGLIIVVGYPWSLSAVIRSLGGNTV